MATRNSNIQTSLDNIAKQLADLTENPRPDYTIDGKTISWSSYMRMLTDQMNQLLDLQQKVEGPYQIHSRGIAK